VIHTLKVGMDRSEDEEKPVKKVKRITIE